MSGADRSGQRPPSAGRRVGAGLFIGELLITLGLVVALFWVWQVAWTSREAEREARQTLAVFDGQLAPARPVAAELHTGPAPTVPAVQPGELIGTLIVPAWQGRTTNRMPVLEGVSADVLNRAAAGHYPSTQQVGQVGNFALAGHRRSRGNNFRYLPDLFTGDALVIETTDYWFVYRVSVHQVVLPDAVEVLAPVPGAPQQTPTEAVITLTTCHSLSLGAYGNDHRWVLHGVLEGWLPRAEGTPEVILAMEAVR